MSYFIEFNLIFPSIDNLNIRKEEIPEKYFAAPSPQGSSSRLNHNVAKSDHKRERDTILKTVKIIYVNCRLRNEHESVQA